MKFLKTAAPAALMLAVLAACSSTAKEAKPAAKAVVEPQVQAQKPAEQAAAEQTIRVAEVDNIDGKAEVAYQCGEKGQDPLNVMYGFSKGQVVVAQVKYKGELTDGLWRAIDFTDRNMFTDGKVTWVADLADAANVAKVDGNMLTIAGVATVNGKQERVDQIVTKYCKLKPAAKAAKAKGKKK